MDNCILVTGGAGFIGSNFIRSLLSKDPDVNIINLDLLTYAGSLSNLEGLPDSCRYEFVKGSVSDNDFIFDMFSKNNINTVVNFAAESHVDRSIAAPEEFLNTNVLGTFCLLEAARKYWDFSKDKHCFLHISTDEVYGSLDENDPPFQEFNKYAPNSPYAASKASSDHFVRAYFKTYGLPTITTNCSNNYGPYQYPEKLIPLMILNALTGKKLPIYGDGNQIRDWLYVTDHCEAIYKVLQEGKIGNTYNIGGLNEQKNIDIVNIICAILDKVKPRFDGKSYKDQIVYVKDRPGHDRRYAMNTSKIKNELDWQPRESFETGIEKTVDWYLKNQYWVNQVMGENYKDWIALNYSNRGKG